MLATEVKAPTTSLAALIQGAELLEIAAVCDPLGARFAAEAGFKAVSLAGYAIGAHLPLSRTLDLDAVEATMRRVVTAAAGVPVLVDGDIGGDAGDLVRRAEAAGAAAVVLAAPHSADLLERVGKAAAARERIMLVARCTPSADQPAPAVSRIRALVDAGCDAVVVPGSADVQPADVPEVPLIFACAQPAGDAAIQPAEPLQRAGYAAVLNKYHRCHCSWMTAGERG